MLATEFELGESENRSGSSHLFLFEVFKQKALLGTNIFKAYCLLDYIIEVCGSIVRFLTRRNRCERVRSLKLADP